MRNVGVYAVAAFAFGAASCADAPTGETVPSPPSEPTVSLTSHPPIEAPPVKAGGETSAGRGVRRLKLDELAASVSVVAGNDDKGVPIQWLVHKPGVGLISGFEDAAFGRVLGRPDYVFITEESQSPSSLELKFIRDMARDVCDRMVRADLARAKGDMPTLFRYASIDGKASPSDIRKNAQYLVLRFHGLRAADDDRQIGALVKLHASAKAAVEHPALHEVPPDAEGWRAVCIALFEDPAFYLD